MRTPLSRRAMLKVFAVAAALPLPGCSSSSEGEQVAAGFFSESERRALGAIANVVIPPEQGSPGGEALGAVSYIERLCTAFDVSPPAIFADGPYSGRAPFADGSFPPNDFARFALLDRVQMKA